MNDNFKLIYKILSALEAAIDLPEFSFCQISAENLGISDWRWKKYMEMLCESGYVDGIRIYEDILGVCTVEQTGGGIHITLRGLEYLSENPIMQQLDKVVNGLKETTPHISQ